MTSASRGIRMLLLVLIAGGVLAALWVQSRRETVALEAPVVLTGYALFVLLLLLFLFNARKRLSMVPLGRASVWLGVHAVGGVLAVALFWLHTGVFWPAGLYEQVLTLLFYLVSLSGLAGYIIQRIYPKRITQRDIEVIYERIPGILMDLRRSAEAVVLSCTRETGSDVLSRYYVETFHWFFQRPRFFLSHIVDDERGDHWVRQQTATVGRYLGANERPYLDKLAEIAHAKNRVDFNHAVQTLMKGWLLVHVPLAAALVVLAVWHLILVNVYAL